MTSATSSPCLDVFSGTCYTLSVSCPDIADWTVTAKVIPPAVTVTPNPGAILFGTGLGGTQLYEVAFPRSDGKPGGKDVIQQVINAGYTAVEFSFGSDSTSQGWLTGPGGPRKLACRYATVAQWAFSNAAVHQSQTAFCATGNSGGSAAISYGLAHYGLDEILDLAEPTSGPPLGRLDFGCLCNGPSGQNPCTGTTISSCYEAQAAGLIDGAYEPNPGPICSMRNGTFASQFLMDSVASPDANLSYPHTDVRFVFGGMDNTEAVPLGLDYANIILTEHNIECVADAPHDIPAAVDGAAQIGNDLTQFCTLRH